VSIVDVLWLMFTLRFPSPRSGLARPGRWSLSPGATSRLRRASPPLADRLERIERDLADHPIGPGKPAGGSLPVEAAPGEADDFAISPRRRAIRVGAWAGVIGAPHRVTVLGTCPPRTRARGGGGAGGG